MAAEVLHERRHLVVACRSSSTCLTAPSAPARKRVPQLGAPVGEQRLVLLVRHLVDVGPQRVAARAGANASCSRRPYLASTTCQPAPSKNSISFLIFWSGTTRSRLWRLVSTTHMHVAEALQRRLGDRLPDVALVELGVTGRGRRSGPGGRDRHGAVGLDVAAHGGGEQRGDDAEADRPGREVEDVGVLGAARVRLQPAEARAAGSGTTRSSSPVRYLMAWYTGEAWGLTATLSSPAGGRTRAPS